MPVHDLSGYLKPRWPAIREQLSSGTYQPQPVERVEIDKPEGRVRKPGIRVRTIAICVGSRRAGERVMASLTVFITTKLKLKVNEQRVR